MKTVGGVGFTNVDILYTGLSALPKAGEEIYAKSLDIKLGGGVPATMINLHRLGISTKLGTFIGSDFFSKFAADELEHYGMNWQNLYKGRGNPLIVTTAMVLPDDRSFLSYCDKQEVELGVNANQVYEFLRGSSIVDMHVGFEESYERLRREGSKLVLDMGWEDTLSFDKCRNALELADYYLPNQKEALNITSSKNVEEAARKLSAFFDNVIIKLDKDGCYLKTAKSAYLISPLDDVCNIDSTGAGDAFLSGFIYGLYHDLPIEKCIACGNVVGGICVTGIGCLTNYVNEERLLSLVNKIKISPV